jgi:hypothetical protein
LEDFHLHLVELGARRHDLLDSELTKFRLELVELLRQILLALGPELAGLNLGGRLHYGEQLILSFRTEMAGV